LLTDGEPTQDFNPPRGIAKTLEGRLSTLPSDALTIHCCGYGYGDTLDSPLLRNIALLGSGSFNYVPDGSMVGTVFIHLMCNLMAVCLNSIVLELRPSDSKVTFNDPEQSIVKVGFLRPGQTRNIYVPYTGSSSKQCPVEISEVLNCEPFKPAIRYQQAIVDVHFQTLRTLFVDAITESMAKAGNKEIAGARGVVQAAFDKLKAFKKDPSVVAMMSDLIDADAEKGQVDKALQNWEKWGCHYLPSLWFAHTRQEKANFKDASMEMYSTIQLDRMIEEAEVTFTRIPPPTPSLDPQAASTLNMGNLMNRSTGCFDGSSLLILNDLSVVCMDKVEAGMVLKGGYTVKCVVKYAVENEISYIFRPKHDPSSLGITAWHPVQTDDGEWEFPCESSRFTKNVETCDAVYNLILDKGHIAEFCGMQCATLGHGFAQAIVSHPYFGSQAVIDDLKKMKGFYLGFVFVQEPEFVRDKETGMVTKIVDATGKSRERFHFDVHLDVSAPDRFQKFSRL